MCFSFSPGAMIAVLRWCETRMTLFHHLKLKRPRMNSADHTPSMSQQPPPAPSPPQPPAPPNTSAPARKKATIGNGNNEMKQEAGNNTHCLFLDDFHVQLYHVYLGKAIQIKFYFSHVCITNTLR